MELHGHVVTGMNNQVVWGLPHVFAIFMIVAASGVLNVASIGSVFGQAAYKPLAPLSGLLCLALLAGGLMVLMLDLGRPDRVIVAATHYNFTSVFAWNVFLYSGMAAIVVVYLWTMFERRLNGWSRPAGMAALVWRFVLTTGTGSIFGFLVARQAYQSALLAPAVHRAVARLGAGGVPARAGRAVRAGRPPPATRRCSAAWRGCSASSSPRRCTWWRCTTSPTCTSRARAPSRPSSCCDGGIYPLLFWGGYVLVGSVAPLVLLFHPRLGGERGTLAAARWWCWAPSPGCSSSSSAARRFRSRSSPATRSAAASPTARWRTTCPRCRNCCSASAGWAPPSC